jgi:hypothetical protein
VSTQAGSHTEITCEFRPVRRRALRVVERGWFYALTECVGGPVSTQAGSHTEITG